MPSVLRCLAVYLVLFAISVPIAGAVTEICGSGYDEDSSGTAGSCPSGEVDAWAGTGCDLLCQGADQDRDGYTTTQGDCDDTNRQIIPDTATTDGCSAGYYRLCKQDGSGYGACTQSSVTPYCPEDCGTCYYIDDVDGSDSTGDGSYASPWQTYLMFTTYYQAGDRPSGWHDVSPGECFVFMGGTYDSEYLWNGVERGLYMHNESCTSGSPCGVYAYPGETVIFDLAGISSDPIPALTISSSNYWTISGIIFENNYTDVSHGSTNAGVINYGSSSNGKFYNNIVRDNDCPRNNNCTGLAIISSDNTEVYNNLLYDNFDSTTTGENNTQFLDYLSTGVNVHDNVMFYTDANAASGSILKKKQADYGDVFTANENILFNGDFCLLLSGDTVTAQRNYISDCNRGVEVSDLGGKAYMSSGERNLEYNTFFNVQQILEYNPTRAYNQDGTSAADKCSGDADIAQLNFRYNIIEDDSGSYAQDTAVIDVDTYGPDQLYADVVTDDTLTIDMNCWYNSAATAFRGGIFPSNNGDTTCAGRGNNGDTYTTWSTWTAAGWDANSFNEDPALDADGIATTDNCKDWGWKQPPMPEAGGGGGESAPSAGTSEGTPPVFVFF